MAVETLLLLVVAVFVGNLVIVWLFVRGDHDVRDFLRDGDDRRPGEAAARPAEHDESPAAAEDGERQGTGTEPAIDPPPLPAAEEVVVCRHCGADNRPGYRYCRWCVRSGFAGGDDGADAGTGTAHRPF